VEWLYVKVRRLFSGIVLNGAFEVRQEVLRQQLCGVSKADYAASRFRINMIETEKKSNGIFALVFEYLV
jgi:hypothetical protein